MVAEYLLNLVLAISFWYLRPYSQLEMILLGGSQNSPIFLTCKCPSVCSSSLLLSASISSPLCACCVLEYSKGVAKRSIVAF